MHYPIERHSTDNIACNGVFVSDSRDVPLAVHAFSDSLRNPYEHLNAAVIKAFHLHLKPRECTFFPACEIRIRIEAFYVPNYGFSANPVIIRERHVFQKIVAKVFTALKDSYTIRLFEFTADPSKKGQPRSDEWSIFECHGCLEYSSNQHLGKGIAKVIKLPDRIHWN